MSSLVITLLAFALLHSVFQGQICLLPQLFLDFLLLHSSSLISLFQRPLAIAHLPSQAGGKFQPGSFGAGLGWFTFGQMPFEQFLDS